MDKTIQQFINECIKDNQTTLVDKCLESELFDYSEIDNYGDNEIFSWYLVDDSLSVKLREAGEPILSNDYGTWWGRTCYGQMIEDDTVIKNIYNKYFN